MARQVNFILNNQMVKVAVEEKELLVDTLRNQLGLTGTKKSCGTGDCGSCTVLIDGRAVRSCITLTCMVEGKEVLTIEGLARGEELHPIQESFIEEGAVQCGYCTPGMILTTKALLDRNHNPSDDEIKEAFSGNFCRCTGYAKIIKAVKVAATKG